MACVENAMGGFHFTFHMEGNSPPSEHKDFPAAEGNMDGWFYGQKCKSFWLILLIDEAEGQALSLHRGSETVD